MTADIYSALASERNVTVSICSPLYNEEGNVAPFVSAVREVMTKLDLPYEIILVDDGSRDGTWREISQAVEAFSEVAGVRLSRNFGHQGALMAGLRQAVGEAVISMDGDLQHPPDAIPELISAWREGAKIVFTRRFDEETISRFKKLTSNYFYQVFSSVSETRIEPGSSDFRLVDRQVLDELFKLKYGEPFLRGAFNTLGFDSVEVSYVAGTRHSGESKYTLPKMLRLARQGLISHSAIPLRLGIYLGLVTGTLSMMELVYVVVQAFRGETVPGWASTLGILSLMFSILFIILGIIGLYLEDFHRLLKQKPHYIIEKVIQNTSADAHAKDDR